MSYLTVQQSEFKTISLESTTQKPRKPSLAASWVTVDGKLVCKWIAVES